MKKRKKIEVVVLHPERLSKNFTKMIIEIYENRIAKGIPMPWEESSVKNDCIKKNTVENAQI
ncbi:hypothetical protein [Clostridium sp.]|jgi:hypothetical protein|uniref:hypothetical protein n=1 Tax=Clostridium sp. TaxID=1506 RepID=UPI003EE9DE2E